MRWYNIFGRTPDRQQPEKAEKEMSITVSQNSLPVDPGLWPYGTSTSGHVGLPRADYEEIKAWMHREGVPQFSATYSLRWSDGAGSPIYIGTITCAANDRTIIVDAKDFTLGHWSTRPLIAEKLFDLKLAPLTYTPAPAPNAPPRLVGDILRDPNVLEGFPGRVLRQITPDSVNSALGDIAQGPDGPYRLQEVTRYDPMGWMKGGNQEPQRVWVKQ